MPDRLIFCPDCAQKYMDENGHPNGFYLAMFGDQGHSNEDLVLVTMTIAKTEPILLTIDHAVRNCDGCKQLCYISQSSYWFLSERTLPETLH